jgi:hypothetical protein
VKLVQTLVVRDEIDVVETQISYHLNAGVDFVIATDHDSRDGTTDVLESFERSGHLRLIREQGKMQDSAWRTRMARLAASEHGADWVIATDADEFWIPWGRTLKEILEGIPESHGVTWALTRPFVPRPDDGEPFHERMTVRLSPHAPINDPTSAYRPHAKVAHRGDPEITVSYGGHLAHAPSLRPLRDWYPVDVLHFPFRSGAQYERKGVRGVRDNKPLGQYVRALAASGAGRVESMFDSLVVDDDAVARGLASGALHVDTRLRDAMRAIRAGEAVAPTPMVAESEVADRVRVIVDAGSLRDADLVRVRRRLDELDVRVARVEGRVATRPGTTAAA